MLIHKNFKVSGESNTKMIMDLSSINVDGIKYFLFSLPFKETNKQNKQKKFGMKEKFDTKKGDRGRETERQRVI